MIEKTSKVLFFENLLIFIKQLTILIQYNIFNPIEKYKNLFLVKEHK